PRHGGADPLSENMEPKIIYQDDDILIINKPSGLITHQKNVDDDQPSVVDWAIKNYPELKNVGDFFNASGKPVARAGIVHRLDKDTSGLLLIAKNNKAFYYLQELFKNRGVQKTYLALVHGKLKNKSGTISSPLGRIGTKRTTQITGKKLIDEKTAETDYKMAKEYKDYSLVELAPKTGRTHQLRVHLKSLNHPIVCDSIYGDIKSCPPELGRLFLHAQKLSFISPSGESISVEADLPPNLSSFIESLANN
ncbi:MAG: RluA family pseudouridine synthase, partial [bacterium]|nr:RluA family pseudouridine synthase [bacterium]